MQKYMEVCIFCMEVCLPVDKCQSIREKQSFPREQLRFTDLARAKSSLTRLILQVIKFSGCPLIAFNIFFHHLAWSISHLFYFFLSFFFFPFQIVNFDLNSGNFVLALVFFLHIQEDQPEQCYQGLILHWQTTIKIAQTLILPNSQWSRGTTTYHPFTKPNLIFPLFLRLKSPWPMLKLFISFLHTSKGEERLISLMLYYRSRSSAGMSCPSSFRICFLI